MDQHQQEVEFYKACMLNGVSPQEMHMKVATDHRVFVELYKDRFEKQAEHSLHQVGGANLIPPSADMQQEMQMRQQQEQMQQQQEQVKSQIEQAKLRHNAELAQLDQSEKQLAADVAGMEAQNAQAAIQQQEAQQAQMMPKAASFGHWTDRLEKEANILGGLDLSQNSDKELALTREWVSKSNDPEERDAILAMLDKEERGRPSQYVKPAIGGALAGSIGSLIYDAEVKKQPYNFRRAALLALLGAGVGTAGQFANKSGVI